MLILLLSACGTGALTPCDSIPDPAPVRACFGGDPVEYEGYGSVELAVDGTVTSVSSDLPDACEVELGGMDASAETVALAMQTTDGASLTVGLQMAGLEVPVSEGDAVSLDLAYTFGEFGPDVGHVSVSKDGSPVAVVTIGGDLGDLAIPAGLVVTEGERLCHEDDGCGAWSKYDLEMRAGGKSATLPYGESRPVGWWQVVHGGYEQADAGGGECPDWYVANAVLGVVDPG